MGFRVGLIAVRRLALAVGLLGAAAILVAGSVSTAGAAETQWIRGTVTDEMTGDPAGGVRVDLYRDGESSRMTYASTNSAGEYALLAFDGDFNVRFAANNTPYGGEWYDDQRLWEAPGVVTVSGGGSVLGIDAELREPQSALEGHVIDAASQPIAGVEVAVYTRANPVELAASGTTDDSGYYFVTGLTDATYDVVFRDPASSYGTHREDSVRVWDGLNTVDAVLFDAASVSGRAVNSYGDPIPGLDVVVGWDQPIVTTTGADGTYTLVGLEPGEHRLYFSDPTGWHLPAASEEAVNLDSYLEVEVVAGEAMTGVDVTMIKGSRLSGHVTGVDGSMVANATVSSVSWLSPAVANLGSGFVVEADAAGAWSVTTYPGAYGLVAEYTDDLGAVYAATPSGEPIPEDGDWGEVEMLAAVGGADITGVDFALSERTGRVRGVITQEGTGLPLEWVGVRLDPLEEWPGPTPDAVFTGPDGSFEIAVPPGEYWVWFWCSSPATECYPHLSLFDRTGSTLDAQVVSVGAGEVVDASSVLPSVSEVSGNITDNVGGHIDNARIYFRDQAGEVIAGRVGTTGGWYEVWLPAGTYDVDVSTHAGFVPEAIEDFVVTGTEAVSLSFALDRYTEVGGTIAGTVTNPDGSASRYAEVMVLDSNGDRVVRGYTDTEGVFSVSGPVGEPLTIAAYQTDGGGFPYLGPSFHADGAGLAIPLVLSVGETFSGIDIQMVEGPMLDVSVATGEDSYGGRVDIVDAVTGNEARWTYPTDGSAQVFLWPGDYVIGRDPYDNWRYPDRSDVMFEWHNDALSVGTADPVSVEVGAVTSIEINYGSASRVAGSVHDGSGTALAGALVVVRGPGDRFAGATITDANGSYWWPIVVPGDYTFEFRHPSHATEWWQDSVSLDEARRLVVGPGENLTGVDVVLGGVDPPYRPPNLAPVANDVSFTVAEDAAVGSVVGVVEVSDPDLDALTVSITAGNTGIAFAIDDDGVVTVASGLDYETLPGYTLTVSVSDGFLTDEAMVTVSVTDVDENLPPAQFTDVDGNMFLADIEWLAQAGITKGCNPPINDMFCPNAYVTRGQMAAFLVRALGLTDVGTVDFVDDDGSVFESSIARLAAAGITKGCNPPDNDMFCPNAYVTRGQMAAFLHRALGDQ